MKCHLSPHQKTTLLSPSQTPTTPSDTLVGVEKDMDSLCDTGYNRNSWIVSQECAIAIDYFNIVSEVNRITLQLEVSEVDVDDIAFCNFDGFLSCRLLG